MICPECGSEYREGFTRCSDCDIDLVEPQPIEPPEPEVQLVKAWESSNAALIPLYESLLQAAQIEFMVRGESIQDLFGWGRFGSGSNLVVGPVEFWVREENVEEARAIAQSLETSQELVENEPDGEGEGIDEEDSVS